MGLSGALWALRVPGLDKAKTTRIGARDVETHC
jgi:hypothetical protein